MAGPGIAGQEGKTGVVTTDDETQVAVREPNLNSVYLFITAPLGGFLPISKHG